MNVNKLLVDKAPRTLFLKFIDATLNAHKKAIHKHPMTRMSEFHQIKKQDLSLVVKELNKIKNENNQKEKENKFNWYDLLEEEVGEAYLELFKKKYKKAQIELEQVAQVAFRAWLWCEEKKKKELKK